MGSAGKSPAKSRKSPATMTEIKKDSVHFCSKSLIYKVIYGRSERIRTFDPLVPNQMRYQAALRSDPRIVNAVAAVFERHPCANTFYHR